ncbi:MAG: Arm DNA-binding domain-containing protein, partial [Alphaproteobacteria bacterium]|nr:Arm DNA-binding domain-containing protein [Alphaproteobacteria bacterium]
MQRNLTDRFIQSINPAPGKRVTVFDTKVTGLCIRVTDTGHRRFYVMSRDPSSKQRWAEVKDGNAPVTSLAKARKLAPEGVGNIKNGKTAFPKIEAPAEVETYEEVVARFIRQYAKPRQRTWKETERILTAIPWGSKLITEITKRDAIKY